MTATWPTDAADATQPADGPVLQPRRGSPDTLTVVPWKHQAQDKAGHPPGDPYIEAVWLGILGPSATLCWARLARLAAVQPVTTIDTVDLAVSLGLSDDITRNRGITRTLHRLTAFQAARRIGDTLAVRTCLPDVPDRALHRLSYSARLTHERLAQPTPSSIPTPASSATAGVEL